MTAPTGNVDITGVGINPFGRFAEKRARETLESDVEIGCILHPSPASPATNRGWPATVDTQLRDLGFEP